MGEPDGPTFQRRTVYFLPRLELVGLIGGALGSQTTTPHFEAEGFAGAGGRLCLDFMAATSDGGPPNYPYNGWGGGACYTALYSDRGFYQQRISAGIRPFLLDGTLMFPVDLTFVHDIAPPGTPTMPQQPDQFGGLLNVGVRWFFHRNLADGPGANMYLGGDIGIGGIGNASDSASGNRGYGGVYGELQLVFGSQFRFP
ncbi:MAG TPA: hypothetical protein VFX30_09995 [bacterium]|nr:hypothetical protein [bacterium]